MLIVLFYLCFLGSDDDVLLFTFAITTFTARITRRLSSGPYRTQGKIFRQTLELKSTQNHTKAHEIIGNYYNTQHNL